MQANNPFEESTDSRNSINSDQSDANNESFRTSLGTLSSPNVDTEVVANLHTPEANQANITDLSQISISPSLFPPTLSSWMGNRDSYSPIADGTDDEEGSFHDCMSNADSKSLSFDSDEFEADPLHNAQNAHVDDGEATETTRLLSKSSEYNREETPLMANNNVQRQSSYNNADETPLMANSQHRYSYNATSATPIVNNTNLYETQCSPLQDALSTWLSPYAESAAKKAGRRLLSFQDKEDNTKSALNIQLPDLDQDVNPSNNQYGSTNHEHNKTNVVRFQPETTERLHKRSSSLFNRVASSPALMTSQSYNESTYPSIGGQNQGDTIVLKEIEPNQTADEDGSVMHPWTKLILLEELGTASSWTVILLPYAFMILALFLDGDPSLKYSTVGPLRGDGRCVDLAGGRIAEPYGVSAKGYFPVPFSYNSSREDGWSNESEACTYPFELREGVGLLSHGVDGSNSTMFSTSMLDAKYRYLMSHGYAFTSGVIPNVPATSQSLIGKAEFNNLSSRAVALVADGGVLSSSIVFQRKSINDNCTLSGGNEECYPSSDDDDHFWSPVLILNPRRLDLRCTFNERHDDDELKLNSSRVDTVESSTWNCASNMIEAFFSLPNAALLVGGDLRVDTLISHHKQHRSLSDDFWFTEMNSELGYRSGNVYSKWSDDFYSSKTDEIWNADLSKPTELLAEITEKSVFTLTHQSESYNIIVELTRIFALLTTFSFLCYWSWMMGYDTDEINVEDESKFAPKTRSERLQAFAQQIYQSVLRSWKKSDEDQSYFWWESPWTLMPDRRYLLLMLFCLLLLQNPLLAYAFFNPSIYSSATFRSVADSISGMSVHGMLFLWLCLMHGLRYHTADFTRRRFEQHRRVIELQQATQHISPPPELQQTKWGRVKWYYKQYGDVEGGGAVFSSALRHKHDINADSFVEFIIPKILLLVIGLVSTVTAACCRFPESYQVRMNQSSAAFLNPDRFGGRGQLYVFSSIVQIIVIQLWGVAIIMTSFVTGERLKREPFLSTRPAQLTFRVLTSILLLGIVISITLFSMFTSSVFGNEQTNEVSVDGGNFVFDTSIESGVESLDSRADVFFRFIRRVSAQVPYVDTSFNIGPGKILYATACSLVAAYIFLPSSHFRPWDKMVSNEDTELHNILSYTKEDILWVKDKMLQGTDKRFVVTLARYTHTWRVFPLPIRSHGLMSQHTIKESLNLIGTFQLDGGFGIYRFKNGRGSIFKGRYIPVFCVEIACWLLEASWQSYYSPTEYALNDWAPGKMSLHSIGLRLERAIEDEETDTHVYVATNTEEQVEGEEDSIIVVSFRGTASVSNMKTDLSFRQVPLPAKLSSKTPSFEVRPGKDIGIEEHAWDVKTSPTSIIENILRSTPSSSTLSSKNGDGDTAAASNLIPAVTDGAKAIIRATPTLRQALPCVHEGFLRNYVNVRRAIIETILDVLKRQVDKAVERSRFSENSCLFLDPEPITLPKIYVTGHSLGGSLAQLLAIDLASNCEIVIEQVLSPKFANDHIRERSSSTDMDQEEFWLGRENVAQRKNSSNLIRLRPPIAVYTYGQPRVGNLAFKTIYKQRVPHTFRVVTEGDAFTSMPTLTCFGGIYRHAGLEVLLDEGCTGNILVGPTVVETLLRFTKVRTSVANHSLAKYRDCLESALEKDDLKEYYKSHSGKVKHDEENLPSWVTNARR